MKILEKDDLSTSEVLYLLDKGSFKEVLGSRCFRDDLFPVKLIESLSKFDVDQENLDAYMEEHSLKIGVSRLFSTWKLTDSNDWFNNDLYVEGDGIIRYGRGLELVTLDRQNISLRYSKIPSQGNYIIHLLASFPSNVSDNFYLSLEGSHYDEAIRFSNTSVTLVNDSSIFNSYGKAIKLYTLHVNSDFARIYTNGILQKSKKRNQKDQEFTALVIRLTGEHGPDLSGYIHGFEIQYVNEKIFDIFEKEKILFGEILKSYINQSDIGEVYRLLQGIDDQWDSNMDDQLLSLLDAQLSKQGVQEWVFDKILQYVDYFKADSWVSLHRDRLPSPILSTHKLSVEFLLTPNKRFSLGSILKKSHSKRFLVLNNLNFDVFPGDIVGIIGSNGAGKSTLLKAVAGLVPINKGEIILRANHLLLSAGLGARNELTGRENIYLAGTFMGLSKNKIDEIFDEIVEFSELGAAIDKPFKYYSDGMKGRLVFSLATSVAPEILLLDELLSAGDIKFQKKAADRMKQLLDRSGAVVVVTHSIQFVAQNCNKALLISGGRLAAYGDPKEVISQYLSILHLGDLPNDSDFNPLTIAIHHQGSPSFIN